MDADQVTISTLKYQYQYHYWCCRLLVRRLPFIFLAVMARAYVSVLTVVICLVWSVHHGAVLLCCVLVYENDPVLYVCVSIDGRYAAGSSSILANV